MSLLSAHGVPMLTDHGYHAMLASSAVGLLGLSSFAGSMALGAIADRFGARPVLAWLYGTRTLLFAALFLVRDSPTALLVVAALGGTSMSGSLAMTSALTADIFGRFSVGSVFGTIFVVHQAGAALGSWLGGLVFEATGGYGLAFALAGVQLLVAAGISLTINEGVRCRPELRPAPRGAVGRRSRHGSRGGRSAGSVRGVDRAPGAPRDCGIAQYCRHGRQRPAGSRGQPPGHLA